MNDDEHMTLQTQQLAQYMHRYMIALEYGDSDTMLLLLQQAEQNPALERIILEVNTMYQSADSLFVTPEEVQVAHQFLHSHLPSAQPTNMVLLTTTTIDDHDDHEHTKMNGKHDTVPLPLSPRKSAQERIDSDMKTIPSTEATATSSTPLATNRRSHKPPATPTRLHRLGRFVQMLAAVLVVAALIGGFAFIAVSHLKTQLGSSDTGKLNGTWRLVSNPNPGASDNELRGVAALSADDVWAVGSSDYKTIPWGTLVEHWNGKQWQVVQTPHSEFGHDSLFGVAAIAPDDVWAVGSSSNPPDEQPLVEHWDGKQWSVVQNPPGSDKSSLNAISAFSANDIWAVGSNYQSGVSTLHTFIEHWDGVRWKVVPSPNTDQPQNYLDAVTALSANDVWTVGYTSRQDFSPVNQALIEHWDGLKWSIVPSPNVNGQQCMLYGVAGAAANDAWAVGVTLNYNTGTGTTLVEHWNGTRWNIIDSPKVGTGNILMQVKAISANNIWAVGYYYATKEDQQNNVSRTLTEHWDGTKWHVIPSPNPKSQSNVYASAGKEAPNMPEMWGVAGVPGTNQVWAVGIQIQVASLSFIERFS